MANVSNIIQTEDLKERISNLDDLSDSVKMLLVDMLNRMDLSIKKLVNELRAEPTIYTVNPVDSDGNAVEEVEGNKPGDVAIYVNDDGATEIEVF